MPTDGAPQETPLLTLLGRRVAAYPSGPALADRCGTIDVDIVDRRTYRNLTVTMQRESLSHALVDESVERCGSWPVLHGQYLVIESPRLHGRV